MNLGKLKASLSRFPADMDNVEVIVLYAKDGEPDFDNLAAVAVPTGLIADEGSGDEGLSAIMLMTDAGALAYAKRGKAFKGDGSPYTEKELRDYRDQT